MRASISRTTGFALEPRALKVNWESDEEMVVMEVVPEGRRSAEDTPSSNWRPLLGEMESDGIVSYTINSHVCERTGGIEGAGGDADTHFTIRPRSDVAPLIFSWAIPRSYTYGSVASMFTASELLNSGLVQRWRIYYNEEDSDLSPKKPLWSEPRARRGSPVDLGQFEGLEVRTPSPHMHCAICMAGHV